MLNKLSLKIRRSIVKTLTPKLYSEWFDSHYGIRPMGNFLMRYYHPSTPLVGVEIGVLEGDHAKSILDNLVMKKLYLIDPYAPYTTSRGNYFDPTKTKQIAKIKLASYNNIEWKYLQSQIAIDELPYELDFVYIDGDHTYEAVKRDINMYYPHVKTGGVIGGHDFSANEIGVTNAVLESRSLFTSVLQGDNSDWWVVKK